MSRDDQTVDAVSEIEESERESLGLNQTRRRKRSPGARIALFIAFLLVVGVMGFISFKAYISQNLDIENTADEESRQFRSVVPNLELSPRQREPRPEREETPPPEMPEQEPVAVQPKAGTQGPQETGEDGMTAAERLQQRRLSAPLNDGGGSSSSVNTPQAGGQEAGGGFMGGGGSESSHALSDKLEPVELQGSSASTLANRDLLITQGSTIDCGLDTRLISTQPGGMTCFTTRNIYSASGRVVLLDKGTKLVGTYEGGLTQGQARAFVLWQRAETPEGVIINLNSPGAGSLGEGGIGGEVDTHFGERFGGAIMISFIGDVGEWLAGQGSSGGNDGNLQLENTSDGAQEAATEALRNSINIPPTLYTNQGSRLSVYVARDLDFSNVYELERGSS